jgi:hypothetical protein
MLSFAVSPSIYQREQELERLADHPSGEIPLSFEELLRGQEKQRKS